MPKPRILLYDIENFPNIAYVWGKYEQNAIAFVRERMICSIAWKWLGQKKTHSLILPDYSDYKPQDPDSRKLVTEFHKIITTADVTIAHNGDRFDDKMLNAEFLKTGLEPPTPRKTIDTLKIARRNFRLNSNRLNDLGELLGVGRKVKHEGFGLWRKCMEGDTAAWKHMRKYNEQDVRLLERVYLKLRPWHSSHPDLTRFTQESGCPVCHSKNLSPRGWVFLSKSRKPRFMCKDCGKWSTGAKVKT